MINPYLWFAEREMKQVPPHFTKCPTPVRPDGLAWIQNKSSGRYAIADVMPTSEHLIVFQQEVYFENEADAIMYELLWSGS